MTEDMHVWLGFVYVCDEEWYWEDRDFGDEDNG